MNQTSLGNTHKHFNIEAIPGLAELWASTRGDRQICIAMIDGNIDRKHPCFNDASLSVVDIFNTSGKPAQAEVSVEHGTSVASIIFGSHNSSVKGIAPGCAGLIIPIFGGGARGESSCSQLDLARAIQVADAQGANIINISGGELSASGKPDVILSNTIQQCIKKGILVVSAVGNDGCECLHVPAADESVLAIGAMDEFNRPLNFSNWGKAYKNNGILFPGKDILAAVPGNGTRAKTGTSFAAAIASGISALLLSLMIKNGRKPDGRMVIEALLKTAVPCDNQASASCEKTLVGYLNLPGAMQQLLSTRYAHVSPVTKSYDEMHFSTNSFAVTPSAYNPGSSPNSNTKSYNRLKTPKKEGKLMSLINETLEATGANMLHKGELTQMPENLYPNMKEGNGVNLSDCGCGCQKKSDSAGELATTTADVETVHASNDGYESNGKKAPIIVYAIGTLGYDFRTESSRDSFQQAMNANPYDPEQILRYLDENPEANEDILWTLSLDATPIYVILPFGGFAETVYRKIRQFYREQLAGGISRISVPGMIVGSTTLLSGQNLPMVMPRGQGMYSWSTSALVEAVAGPQPNTDDAKAVRTFNTKREGLENFLERIYYELRNLGITSQERALNFAATNAFQMDRVFEKAAGESLELDTIEVEKSPICKPGSDCWDVKLVFFNPEKRIQQARKIYRFTIDVSNVIPVTVGAIRSWNIY